LIVVADEDSEVDPVLFEAFERFVCGLTCFGGDSASVKEIPCEYTL
jgi:hypothetical protein